MSRVIGRRGASVTEDPRVTYTEIDLPAVIQRKRQLLDRTAEGRGVAARPGLRLVEADVETVALEPFAQPNEPVFVIAEGRMMYLAAPARRLLFATGRRLTVWPYVLGLLVVLPLMSVLIFGKPVTFESPVRRGFNFASGSHLLPEFVALLIALSTYTAAFIGEIVRAGVLSVHKGQMEAGASLGLTRGATLRLIVVPQAMRVILPPLTNQYLNLTKNSSLAVAIGYQDVTIVFEQPPTPPQP